MTTNNSFPNPAELTRIYNPTSTQQQPHNSNNLPHHPILPLAVGAGVTSATGVI
jgi:hypothetical protein